MLLSCGGWPVALYVAKLARARVSTILPISWCVWVCVRGLAVLIVVRQPGIRNIWQLGHKAQTGPVVLSI